MFSLNFYINFKINVKFSALLAQIIVTQGRFCINSILLSQDVTISYVVPCVLALYQHMESFKPGYLKAMVNALLDSMKKRFHGIIGRAKGTYLHEDVDASQAGFVFTYT